MELNNFEPFYYVVITIFATSLAVISVVAGVYPQRPCGFSSDFISKQDRLLWSQHALLKLLVWELWVALTVGYSTLVLLVSLIRAVHLDNLHPQHQGHVHQQPQGHLQVPSNDAPVALPPEFPNVDMEYAPKEILYQVRVRRQQRTIVRTTRRVLAYLLVPIFGHTLQVVDFGLQMHSGSSDWLSRTSSAMAAGQPILMAICLLCDPVVWPLFSDIFGLKSRRRLVAENGKFLGLKRPISVVGRTFAEEEGEVKYSLQSF